MIGSMQRSELIAKLDTNGLPFATISLPEYLFEDHHLLASDGILEVTILSDEERERLWKGQGR